MTSVKSIRIATWNVERPKDRPSRRTENLLEKIKAIGADIWILTETHEVIIPEAGFEHRSSPTIRSAPINHEAGEHKVTIWSRWPITEIYEPSTEHRAVCITIDSPIGRLIVYGTVMPYHAARWPYGTHRNWDAHYAAIATQGADWRRLKGKFPASGLCVAGDFNQNRTGGYRYGTKWGRSLLNFALNENSLDCVTQIDHPAASRLGEQERQIATRSIDHICLSQKWVGLVSEIGVWSGVTDDGQYLSDHSGVYVDLVG